MHICHICAVLCIKQTHICHICAVLCIKQMHVCHICACIGPESVLHQCVTDMVHSEK